MGDVALKLPNQAQADIKYFPIPAVSTSKNDGHEITVKRGAEPLYSKDRLEVNKMFASESKRAILVIRGDLQATIGADVPFYKQSALGGQNNLRGFGVDPYIDQQLIACSPRAGTWTIPACWWSRFVPPCHQTILSFFPRPPTA
ncbi:MAG: hypothetical protein AABZ34_05890 [Nitrospirota bacterium]